MEYCRRVDSLRSISDLEFFERLKEAVGHVDFDKIILGIRNGNLFCRQTLPTGKKIDEEEWWLYLDMINDVKDYLRLEGYIRHDIDNIMMPERYFAEMYAIPCGLVDSKTCQPYFFSNEAYETYAFGYDRLRLILDILAEELTPQQFIAVREDIMYADKYCFEGNSTDITAVRQFLRNNRRRLKQRFSVCWWL